MHSHLIYILLFAVKPPTLQDKTIVALLTSFMHRWWHTVLCHSLLLSTNTWSSTLEKAMQYFSHTTCIQHHTRVCYTGVGDVERSVTRLCSGAAGAGRDAAHVILYEDVGKRKVKALKAALDGLKVGLVETMCGL